MASRDQLVPNRRLPVLYLAFAHVSMLLAVAVVAFDPVSLTGYFYHPLMIGVVHLVTLGWISGSIIGALFIVGPLVLRMPMPVSRLDYWAFAFYTIGVTGIVSHFWIEQYSGMAWSAAMVVLAVAQVTGKVLRQLSRASIPLSVRLHIGLACINFVAAGVLGVLLGADREVDIVPGSAISNVYAHAHLAGLGWATLMVVGVGYRLLPMVLPSAMPKGLRVVTSLVLVQLGVMGVCWTLLMTGEASPGWAVFAVAGIVTFLSGAAWMRRHPRRSPPARPQPDWGVGHALQSLAYLLTASLIGLALVLMPTTTWTERLAMLYGVVALLGFLSQVIIGMEHRILPLFQWQTSFKASGFADQPPSPHTMGSQSMRAVVFGFWTMGVPVFATGMALEQVTVVGIGSWAILVAVLLHTVNTVRTLRSPIPIAEHAEPVTQI